MNPSAEHTKTAVLTVSLILSLALYFVLFFIFINRDVVINGTSLWVSLALTLHAVPAFCLQWLLCQTEKPVWARWHLEPVDLAAPAVLAAGLYFLFRK